MNVYDFDGTIYQGDSTIDFYFYCLKKSPRIIKKIPRQMFAFIKYKWKKINKTEFKSDFFSFMEELEDYQKTINDFWHTHKHKIAVWYREKQQKNDLIISASPSFLLKEICDQMRITNLIASEVDPFTGKFLSLNCYGQEKVRRYLSIYGQSEIEEFYSDSLSDQPMASLAKVAYMVKKNKIMKWRE